MKKWKNYDHVPSGRKSLARPHSLSPRPPDSRAFLTWQIFPLPLLKQFVACRFCFQQGVVEPNINFIDCYTISICVHFRSRFQLFPLAIFARFHKNLFLSHHKRE